jgi:hypothetical protein
MAGFASFKTLAWMDGDMPVSLRFEVQMRYGLVKGITKGLLYLVVRNLKI